LVFCAKLNAIPSKQVSTAVTTALERCGLTQVSKRLIGNLSKGYQQRVGIAQAIIHSPAVVILDEPTSGLDPIQIREIRQLIRDIANEHSVILSTHILPEVQTLCDRVQIINQGQLLFNDTIENLSQYMQTSSLIVELRQAPKINELLSINGVIDVTEQADNKLHIHYSPEQDPTDVLVQSAVHNGWQLKQLTPQQHTLEDAFMQIIHNEAPIEESTN
jgi:ABC-2 type transport system ATP-binding protein